MSSASPLAFGDRVRAGPGETTWAGVDPGITGALAIIRPKGGVHVIDMPTRAVPGKMRRELDARELARNLSALTGAGERIRCVIERIHARPEFAIQSQGRMMDTNGSIKAACEIAGWQIDFVDPKRWKSFYGLDAEKARSLDVARKLYPLAAESFLTLAKHHNRAEALLIAHFGRRTLEA